MKRRIRNLNTDKIIAEFQLITAKLEEYENKKFNLLNKIKEIEKENNKLKEKIKKINNPVSKILMEAKIVSNQYFIDEINSLFLVKDDSAKKEIKIRNNEVN